MSESYDDYDTDYEVEYDDYDVEDDPLYLMALAADEMENPL